MCHWTSLFDRIEFRLRAFFLLSKRMKGLARKEVAVFWWCFDCCHPRRSFYTAMYLQKLMGLDYSDRLGRINADVRWEFSHSRNSLLGLWLGRVRWERLNYRNCAPTFTQKLLTTWVLHWVCTCLLMVANSNHTLKLTISLLKNERSLISTLTQLEPRRTTNRRLQLRLRLRLQGATLDSELLFRGMFSYRDFAIIVHLNFRRSLTNEQTIVFCHLWLPTEFSPVCNHRSGIKCTLLFGSIDTGLLDALINRIRRRL